jgi:hypothetical protein
VSELLQDRIVLNLENSVSTETAQREILISNTHVRAAIAEHLLLQEILRRLEGGGARCIVVVEAICCKTEGCEFEIR